MAGAETVTWAEAEAGARKEGLAPGDEGWPTPTPPPRKSRSREGSRDSTKHRQHAQPPAAAPAAAPTAAPTAAAPAAAPATAAAPPGRANVGGGGGRTDEAAAAASRKAMAFAPLKEGDGVWLEKDDEDGNQAFEHATVLGYFSDGSCAMKTASGDELLAHDPLQLQRAAPPGEARQEDQCDLVHLNDGCMLRNLQMRFDGTAEEALLDIDGELTTSVPVEIHTWTGRMLLVVNPRCYLPIYGAEAMAAQLPSRNERRGADGEARREPPHVYAVAEQAYRGATAGREDQAIVVSGESGAGKTESAKHMLGYLVWRGSGGGGGGAGGEAPPKAGGGGGLFGGGGGGTGVGGEQSGLLGAVVRAGDVLEACGNAATTLNLNSSRFGKFVKLSFGPQGRMRGATIETSLLEKGRVVRHGAGERSFHALHGLAAACDALQVGGAMSWLKSWGAGDVTSSSSGDAQLEMLKLRRSDLPERGGRLAYLQAAAEQERDVNPNRKSQSSASSDLGAVLGASSTSDRPLHRVGSSASDIDARAADEAQQPEALRRFRAMHGAMRELLTPAEVAGVLRLLGAVLHLGNVSFAADGMPSPTRGSTPRVSEVPATPYDAAPFIRQP